MNPLLALLGDCYTVDPASGCWSWTRGRTAAGYGAVSIAGRVWNAHRVSYLLDRGVLEDGLDVDHLCHNADAQCLGGADCAHRACVRPDHLRAVPRGVNVLASQLTLPAQNKAKTHCPQGHSYDEANTVLYDGRRFCRACKDRRNAAARAARAARVVPA